MGMENAGRQSRAPIVAFDFDGTLTFRDSFMAFLAWRSQRSRFAAGLARLAPAALVYATTRDRARFKTAAVTEFLGGTGRAALEAEARRFAMEMSPRLLREDAVRCWESWRRRGARLVIVTASPETIVQPFARDLGADCLIGTRLAFDAADRVTGEFEGGNCRGPGKVTRLEAVFGGGVRLEAAYGDSGGDREMLARARQPGLRVFKARR